MKKWLSVFLAFVMLVSFCACGGDAPQEVVEEEEKKDYISVDNVTVIEDHRSYADCSITITNNFEENIDRIEIEYKEVDDDGNVIDSGSLYISAPGFGQSTTEEMQIHNNLKDVASLEFVSYNLLTSDYKFYESHTFAEPVVFVCAGSKFYVKGTEPEKEPVTELSVGETAKTDKVELTVTDVYFADLLSIYTYTPIDSGSGFAPSDDNVYVCIRFNIKNMGKETLEWKDFCDFEIDYNNGYIFPSYNGSRYSYMVKPDGTDYVKFAENSSQGSIEFLPLSGDDVLMIIETSKMLEEDTESPLQVRIVLPSSVAEKEFVYNVR